MSRVGKLRISARLPTPVACARSLAPPPPSPLSFLYIALPPRLCSSASSFSPLPFSFPPRPLPFRPSLLRPPPALALHRWRRRRWRRGGTPRRGRQAGWAPDQGGEGDNEGHCRMQTRTTRSTPGKEAGTWNTDVAMRRRGRGATGGRERGGREGGSLRGG